MAQARCRDVLVGFTSSIAIVFQAALAFNATPAEIASWMWAPGIGMGLCSVIPSLWLKKPVGWPGPPRARWRCLYNNTGKRAVRPRRGG